MNKTFAAAKKVSERSLPPMLVQYLEYKDNYPDSVLFFQVGDFYELFFEDAVTVSKLLNLTLTSRDKNNPEPVPMCGVPVAAVDSYVERLVDRGLAVALVSQAEPASQAKGMVRRELERIVTPGVRVLGTGERSAAEAPVAAVAFGGEGKEVALAFSDVQSGEIHIRDGFGITALAAEIEAIAPAEVVFPRVFGGKRLDRRWSVVRQLERSLAETSFGFRDEAQFDAAAGRSRDFAGIPGYSALSPIVRRAVWQLAYYVDEITVGRHVTFERIIANSSEEVLVIDAATRSNLELLKNTKDGSEQGSLAFFLDRTRTAPGAQLLRKWIAQPLRSRAKIAQRLEAVRTLMAAPEPRVELQALLARWVDVERIAVRIELGAAGPRELGALRDSLECIPEFRRVAMQLHEASELLAGLFGSMSVPSDCTRLLRDSLQDELPASLHEGGVIRDGVDEELDRLREIRASGKSWIAQLEAREKQATGIQSLKIKYNGVLGYFFEVTKANVGKVPPHFISRQSTVHSERYFTTELKDREKEMSDADQKLGKVEQRLFDALRRHLVPYIAAIRSVGRTVAALDVLVSFAEAAAREDLVEPRLTEGPVLEVSKGRHPVVMRQIGKRFVPNDIVLNAERGTFVVLTGPNMGGKSTYLRQIGLITIMAQAGSFVPAAEACIGIADRVFARLGASDDLHEGESTFMVEMREAAHILRAASLRSLVLIDELGRGTATSDGLALAQSVVEWMAAQIGCRAVFATHFHPLTTLAAAHASIRNISVNAVQDGSSVVFTHEISEGPAAKSYGIEVARRAGLPAGVLRRADTLLRAIHEQEALREEGSAPEAQLSIFGVDRAAEQVTPSEEYTEHVENDCVKIRISDTICDEIRSVDVNNLTPLEALQRVHEWARQLNAQEEAIVKASSSE